MNKLNNYEQDNYLNEYHYNTRTSINLEQLPRLTKNNIPITNLKAEEIMAISLHVN